MQESGKVIDEKAFKSLIFKINNMEGFKPGTLGAGLIIDPTISPVQARRNGRKSRDKIALKSLDHALRHGGRCF